MWRYKTLKSTCLTLTVLANRNVLNPRPTLFRTCHVMKGYDFKPYYTFSISFNHPKIVLFISNMTILNTQWKNLNQLNSVIPMNQ